jgi:long-subunit acyl-CoA synthetase (AMP-forming)
MPFLAAEHLPIPTKDLLSWMFDDIKYDIDKPLYIDAANPSQTISARQAKSTIRKLAAGLRNAGLQKGDTVCLHSANHV